MHLLVWGGGGIEKKKAQLTVPLTQTNETSMVQTAARSNRGRTEPYWRCVAYTQLQGPKTLLLWLRSMPFLLTLFQTIISFGEEKRANPNSLKLHKQWAVLARRFLWSNRRKVNKDTFFFCLCWVSHQNSERSYTCSFIPSCAWKPTESICRAKMLTRKKEKQPLNLVLTNGNTKSMDEEEAFQPEGQLWTVNSVLCTSPGKGKARATCPLEHPGFLGVCLCGWFCFCFCCFGVAWFSLVFFIFFLDWSIFICSKAYS